MSEEMNESTENLETTAPETSEEVAAKEATEAPAEETTESTAETEAPSTEEKEVKPTGKFYTQTEIDAMAAAARKQGISRGKKDVMEEMQGTVPDQIYDPTTGHLMDPNDPVYGSVRQKFSEDATMQYNKKLQIQKIQQETEARVQAQVVQEVANGYAQQEAVLRQTDPEGIASLYQKIKADWHDKTRDPMISIAATTKGGLEAMLASFKSDPAKLDRISNLPAYKQAAEMGQLINNHAKGKGAAKTKSNAPKPMGSYASGGASSGNKAQKNKTYEDIEAEMRAKMNFG